MPAVSRYAATATFVDVPINVQVPPIIDAKARGINIFEADNFDFRARASIGEINNAVTVVLFMNADNINVKGINHNIKPVNFAAFDLLMRSAITSKIPDSSMPPVMMNILASIMMKSLPKDSNASEVVIIPVATNTINKSNVIISTDNLSVENNMMASISKPSTIAISILKIYKGVNIICEMGINWKV